MIHFCSSYNSCVHRKSVLLRWKSPIDKSSDFLAWLTSPDSRRRQRQIARFLSNKREKTRVSDVMTLSPPKRTCRQSKGDNLWREISDVRRIYFFYFGEAVKVNNYDTVFIFSRKNSLMYSNNEYKKYDRLK